MDLSSVIVGFVLGAFVLFMLPRYFVIDIRRKEGDNE